MPADLTVGQFVYVIRKRIKLSPEKAIFIFVDEVLPPTAALMSSIYDEHKDEDGFLYITYDAPPRPAAWSRLRSVGRKADEWRQVLRREHFRRPASRQLSFLFAMSFMMEQVGGRALVDSSVRVAGVP